MFNKIIKSTLLLLFSVPLYAGTWSSWTEVDEIYPTSGGGVFIKFDSMINPDSCNNSTWMSVPDTNGSQDKIYAAALMAKATNSEIRYNINGCDINYPNLNHVQLR